MSLAPMSTLLLTRHPQCLVCLDLSKMILTRSRRSCQFGPPSSQFRNTELVFPFQLWRTVCFPKHTLSLYRTKYFLRIPEIDFLPGYCPITTDPLCESLILS